MAMPLLCCVELGGSHAAAARAASSSAPGACGTAAIQERMDSSSLALSCSAEGEASCAGKTRAHTHAGRAQESEPRTSAYAAS